MPKKDRRSLSGQTTSQVNGGGDCVVQTRALDRTIGNDAFYSGGCFACADLSQSAERSNLLPDCMRKTKALKPPTECFKRRDGGDKATATGFGAQSKAVSRTHTRESGYQSRVLEVVRHGLVRLGGSDHAVLHPESPRREEIKLSPRHS
jgi:hypothetical protein